MAANSAIAELALNVQADAKNGALHVSYSIENPSQQSIVAYDGATGTGGGEFQDLTTGCYVSYSEGICRLLRIRPSPHPFRTTTRILIPPASVIDPGKTRSVHFRLPLPLKERAEYTPDYPGATYELRTVRRLQIQIGYFRRTEDTVLKNLPIPGVWQVIKGAPLVETFLMEQSCSATFEMLVRTDADFLRM